jgi:LysM repeat protein
MKSQTLPVKRRPVSKGIFHRLNAVTRNRRQRVAAAAPAAEMETDDSSSKISRALTIIFLIHIVAIALIFIHQRFLDGRAPEEVSTAVKTAPEASAPAALPAQRRDDLPRLSTGEKPYIVRTGDNYARIATAEGVDEGDLRMINKHVDIGPGLILKIPPKRMVAEDPPEVTAIRAQTPSDRDRGLVEAVDLAGSPKAQLVRPNVVRGVDAAAAPVAASGKSYVVQPGDSIFRIASRFKVSQDSLMRANGIADPRKMKTGMRLSIPAS